MQKELLFVYGTLKKGFCNHYFLADAEFLGKAETLEKYALYLKGSIPYVIKQPPISHIKGEVYKVDLKTLKEIDELEGHPYLYFREIISVRLYNGKILSAWMYFFPPSEEPGILIPTGEYTDKLIKD